MAELLIILDLSEVGSCAEADCDVNLGPEVENTPSFWAGLDGEGTAGLSLS